MKKKKKDAAIWEVFRKVDGGWKFVDVVNTDDWLDKEKALLKAQKKFGTDVVVMAAQ